MSKVAPRVKRKAATLVTVKHIKTLSGEAKPNPKMGQALGPLGLNMIEFCKRFNAQSSTFKKGLPVTCKLKLYTDKTYKLQIDSPTCKDLIYRLNNIEKGPTEPRKSPSYDIGWIDVRQIYELAKIKCQDEGKDFHTVRRMANSIAVYCRHLGIKVVQIGGPSKNVKVVRNFKPPYDIFSLFSRDSIIEAEKQLEDDLKLIPPEDYMVQTEERRAAKWAKLVDGYSPPMITWRTPPSEFIKKPGYTYDPRKPFRKLVHRRTRRESFTQMGEIYATKYNKPLTHFPQ